MAAHFVSLWGHPLREKPYGEAHVQGREVPRQQPAETLEADLPASATLAEVITNTCQETQPGPCSQSALELQSHRICEVVIFFKPLSFGIICYAAIED